MSAIKKFFEKRKLNVKFKRAGEGHRLDESDTSTSHQTQHRPSSAVNSSQRPSSSKKDNDAARKAAADAALSRMSAVQQSKTDDTLLIQRTRMKREMEAEKKRLKDAEERGAAARSEPQEIVQDAAPMVESILFKCPLLGPVVLPKAEMEEAIHQFFLDNLEEEPVMTSALMIHTLNKNKDTVKVCIDTLIKYLDNIISNPSEEKFLKIRQSNKIFQERVACLKGTDEFLIAAGFSVKLLPFEDHETNFYVFDSELAKDAERLINMKEVLLQAEPIRPELDRDVKIYHPSSAATKFDIPQEFYSITPEELKKEQQRREEASEKLGMLRTKAMRERDEQRELRRYRYALIRVRLPDGVLLQGVFKAMENITNVYEFIRENLENNWIPFQLSTATGHKLEEGESSLVELGLAPAAVVNFSWDATVIKEVAAQQGQAVAKVHLKKELMDSIQQL